MPMNPNNLECRRIRMSFPGLFVYRGNAFSGNLPVVETVFAETCLQGPPGYRFLAASRAVEIVLIGFRSIDRQRLSFDTHAVPPSVSGSVSFPAANSGARVESAPSSVSKLFP